MRYCPLKDLLSLGHVWKITQAKAIYYVRTRQQPQSRKVYVLRCISCGAEIISYRNGRIRDGESSLCRPLKIKNSRLMYRYNASVKNDYFIDTIPLTCSERIIKDIIE
jgi:hypothetical protein